MLFSLSTVSVEQQDKEQETDDVKLTQKPEVIDDFIRNFLAAKGMLKSLDTFQNEWYELQKKGKLCREDTTTVPNVYARNQELAEALQKVRIDVENYKDIASKARSTYDKLRKERDFHRMHHKRVVQEKNKLIHDIKRLKSHYDSYEPTLKQLQHKYEVAMKEKMLTKLERDKLAAKLVVMERTQKQPTLNEKKKKGPPKVSQTDPRDSTLPIEDRVNPFAGADLPYLHPEKIRQNQSIIAHDGPVTCIKFHPRKVGLVATVSDDKSWKIWSFPSAELVMSAQGHKDWISDCDFHPRGSHLATASGDHTLKVWDFSKSSATLSLSDHTGPVWSCAFHDSGDFILSSSADHTAKLWDVNSGRCRQTFRGHVDAVNHASWVPFTNVAVTASGDKTVSFWDARTGLCASTFYGHLNAVNHVSFTLDASKVASCDADGGKKKINR